MKFLTPTVACTAICLSASAHATLIVDWGGDYVSADQGFQLPADLNNNKTADRGYATSSVDAISSTFFDSSSPISPASGYSGTSASFYGGFQAVLPDAGSGSQGHSSTSGSRTEIRNVGTTDQLVWGNNNGRAFHTVTLWQTAGVNLGSGSYLSTNVNFIGDNGSEDLRFMVESAGQFYVSTTNTTTAGPFALSGAALQNENWIAVPLNDDSFTNLNYDLSGSGSSLSLTDIDYVGLYFRTFNTENNDNLVIDSFEAFAESQVIPEPASLALIGVGGNLVMGRRRRS